MTFQYDDSMFEDILSDLANKRRDMFKSLMTSTQISFEDLRIKYGVEPGTFRADVAAKIVDKIYPDIITGAHEVPANHTVVAEQADPGRYQYLGGQSPRDYVAFTGEDGTLVQLEVTGRKLARGFDADVTKQVEVVTVNIPGWWFDADYVKQHIFNIYRQVLTGEPDNAIDALNNIFREQNWDQNEALADGMKASSHPSEAKTETIPVYTGTESFLAETRTDLQRDMQQP